MTDKVILKGELRTQTGTVKTAILRKEGKLPAVMYGHGEETASFSVDLRDFTESILHGHRLFDVEVGGKTETLLVKEIQYDHLGKDFIHVDFIRVNLAELVSVTVGLKFKGVAAGASEGGMLDVHLNAIEIECKVRDIPEVINVNVKEIGIGDSIHASDIELPEGAVLKTDGEALILNCHIVAEAKTTEELEGETPSSPEVITEKEENPED